GRDHHVVGADLGGALVLGQLGVVLQSLGECDAQARLVRAAFWRRDRVAVGMNLRIAAVPGDRPFERAMATGFLGAAREDLAGDGEVLAKGCGEIILQAAGEMEDGLFRDFATSRDEARVAAPADFDAAEEVGLGTGHAEDAAGIEAGMVAEYLRIGVESDLGAAAIVDVAEFLEAALRHAAGETLPVELAIARNLDLEHVRKGIDDRDADTMQAAGRLVGVAVELA